MTEYISRNDYKNKLKKYFFIHEADEIKEILDEIPAANVRENKHGKWVECSNKLGNQCSICETWNDFRENFCPNCGADMRGENEQNND